MRHAAAIVRGVCKRAAPARRIRLRVSAPCALRRTLNRPRVTLTGSTLAPPLPSPRRLRCLGATPLLIQPADEPYTAQ